ncbi:hypothetical protein SBRCBS47491_007504 [Sporothrix bragantina]|uniref:Uncharacterized protein n=1 Tax=Sporothrix bragantina TaxID=671064 RepID=A0ABP0CDQ1_9PEZI
MRHMPDPQSGKVDVSLDSDFGDHSVSQVLAKRKVRLAKVQPWKLVHVVDKDDVPETMSLHDKPWFRTEFVADEYKDDSGA